LAPRCQGCERPLSSYGFDQRSSNMVLYVEQSEPFLFLTAYSKPPTIAGTVGRPCRDSAGIPKAAQEPNRGSQRRGDEPIDQLGHDRLSNGTAVMWKNSFPCEYWVVFSLKFWTEAGRLPSYAPLGICYSPRLTRFWLQCRTPADRACRLVGRQHSRARSPVPPELGSKLHYKTALTCSCFL
jgi:hypothetical protein